MRLTGLTTHKSNQRFAPSLTGPRWSCTSGGWLFGSLCRRCWTRLQYPFWLLYPANAKQSDRSFAEFRTLDFEHVRTTGTAVPGSTSEFRVVKTVPCPMAGLPLDSRRVEPAAKVCVNSSQSDVNMQKSPFRIISSGLDCNAIIIRTSVANRSVAARFSRCVRHQLGAGSRILIRVLATFALNSGHSAARDFVRLPAKISTSGHDC